MQGQAKDLVNLVGSQIVIFLLCLTCWLLSVFLLQSNRFSQWQKLVLAMLGSCILSVLFYYGFNKFFEDFPLDPLSNYSLYVGVRRMAYRGLLIGVILYPSAYFLDTQRRLHAQRIRFEQRKQQNTLAALNYLRQQMNPHFLFNALTILKSGAEDPWVKKYTQQLADIYRYFLSANSDMDLISLHQELLFIDSYSAILKSRFQEGLEIINHLENAVPDAYLPPLSIQILIENAIKHNVVSMQHPLIITISEQSNAIVVSNTKRKKWSADTNGTGLINLNKRYHLLSDTNIIIEETDAAFTVKLPLLNK